MKNPFYPKDLDEAIARVNNGTSTAIDHHYLEVEFGLQKYKRKKLRKLVGETIVYICEVDKNGKWVKTLKEYKFPNAGQARIMEKDVLHIMSPEIKGNEDRYVKIGYTCNTPKYRLSSEKRWNIRPGASEIYPYDKKDELITFCESIKDNYEDVRGINPN